MLVKFSWATMLFIGLLGLIFGNKIATGAQGVFGPCQSWNCTGTYAGYDNSSPPWNAPTTIPDCVLISNVVPTCQNTNTTSCDPYYSQKQMKGYLCRGTSKSNPLIDCWSRFYGCK